MEQKNTRWEVAKPLSLALAVVFGMFFGWKISIDSPVLSKAGKNNVQSYDYSYEVLKYLRAQYVDSLDFDELNEVAVNAMMSHLDPFSAYLTPSEVELINDRMKGSYKGIGVEFYYIDDTLNIIRVLENSPAENAGIQVGDKLLKANNQSLLWDKNEANLVSRILKSSKDSVEFNVIRDNRSIDITLRKEHINTPSVTQYGMLASNVAYIRIQSFNSDTYRDFMLAIESLVTENQIENLIIDVRDNPGGYLDAVVKIISQLFEEKDKMIVYTKSAGSNITEYKTTGKSFFKIGKIAVLVNGNSASASEILAGAIQDHDRGIVIGEKTYGKGMVQEQFSLSNKGAVRLTTARFYTPSGRSIQKNGVRKAGKNLNISNADTVSVEAFTTSNGRKVESGGGILPDILVSENLTSNNTDVIQQNFDLVYEDIIRCYLRFESQNKGLDVHTYIEKLDQFGSDYLSDREELDLGIDMLLDEVGEESLWAFYRKYIINLKFSDFESLKDLFSQDDYVQTAVSAFEDNRYNEIIKK